MLNAVIIEDERPALENLAAAITSIADDILPVGPEESSLI